MTNVTDTHPDLDVLVGHIVDVHHAYVRSACPQVAAWLDRLVELQGDAHPELQAVREVFADLADELLTHLVKEENILFPFITDLAVAKRAGARPPMSPFGTLLNPIRVMGTDHARAGELLTQLRALSNGFVVPPDGGDTYRLCFAELAQFDRDLERHIHLEEDVLFPQAIELERTLG